MKNSKGDGVFGLVLLLVGGALLLGNISDIDLHYYLINWKTIIIILGAAFFIAGDDKTFGTLLMAFGGLAYYADHIGVTLGSVLRDYWPVFLIIIGLGAIIKSMLPGRSRRKKDKDEKCRDFRYKKYNKDRKMKDTSHFESNERDFIDEYVMFNTLVERNDTSNFTGGKLTVLFAGAEFDLRDAKLGPGKNILHVFCAFGAIELYVPSDWKIVTNISVVFGGIDDKRHRTSAETVDSDKVLEINGTVLLGGIEIKN